MIQDGKAGLSLTAFAGGIGVARSTINQWMAEHPEFSEAVKQHQAARTRHLEETMLSAEQGPRVTARIFALKNAAPEEWRDRHELTGADGGAIQLEDRRPLDLRSLEPAGRDLLITLLRQALAKPVEQIEGEYTSDSC